MEPLDGEGPDPLFNLILPVPVGGDRWSFACTVCGFEDQAIYPDADSMYDAAIMHIEQAMYDAEALGVEWKT